MDRHPKKEVQEAIEYAEGARWRFEKAGGGHVWGKGYCPCGECPVFFVHSTPKVPGNHAKSLRRAADRCPGT